MAEFNQEESEIIVEEITNNEEKEKDIYDKLRKKVGSFAQEKIKGKYGVIVDYLLLLPDFVALLIRLAKDSRIPSTQKIMVGGIILYVISPIDIIPDFIPVLGLADDLLLVVYGLNTILNEIDVNIVREHWSGSEDLLELLRNATDIAEKFLSKNVVKKVSAFFSALKGKK